MTLPADPFISSDSWLGNVGLTAILLTLLLAGLVIFAKGVFDLIREFMNRLRKSDDGSGRHAAD
jgi:hypothetical protein